MLRTAARAAALLLAALAVLGVAGEIVRDRSPAPRTAMAPPPSPQPSQAPTPTPVPASGPLVLTYYFYWYDATNGGHLQDSVLHTHPPASPAPTWRSVDWHERQLSDMAYAGIDVALAVFWGSDKPEDRWSTEGLPVLAAAHDRLQAAGQDPPAIGLFFDTSIVDMRDLTTPTGKEWFYDNVRGFFQRVPPRLWATVDGRPIVFLFTSDTTAAVDQTTFDHLYQSFERDFGVRPYLVREVSWDYPILGWERGERVRDYSTPIHTDNSYLWAAAMHGFVDRGGVATVGPGFNDSGLPGRGAGTVTDRDGGTFYLNNFRKAIESRKPLLALETWNEYHEASDIAESQEYGRTYLDLTRQLTLEYKAALGATHR